MVLTHAVLRSAVSSLKGDGLNPPKRGLHILPETNSLQWKTTIFDRKYQFFKDLYKQKKIIKNLCFFNLTLPETNSLHLKMDGWNAIVSFWVLAYLNCYFQGDIALSDKRLHPTQFVSWLPWDW